MKTKPTKRKLKVPANQLTADCDQDCGTTKPRRSISAKEVDEMLEQQAKVLRKEPTLYDRRVELIQYLNKQNSEKDYHEGMMGQLSVEITNTRQELEAVNKQLQFQLNLDSTR